MNILTKIFLFLLVVTPLVAQETNEPAAPVSNEQATESPAAAEGTSPAAAINNAANVVGASASSLPENTMNAAGAPSGVLANAAPDASPDNAAAIAPTDPSMIPPPVDGNAPQENATASPAAPEEDQAAAAAAMPSTESIEKKQQENKVRYYEVRTQVEKEPEVTALKTKADQATTDEGKRQALRAYYELLFAKMKKVDPSISKRCDLMQGAYLRRLEQTTLQPSIPLAPAPSAEAPKNNTTTPVSKDSKAY